MACFRGSFSAKGSLASGNEKSRFEWTAWITDKTSPDFGREEVTFATEEIPDPDRDLAAPGADWSFDSEIYALSPSDGAVTLALHGLRKLLPSPDDHYPPIRRLLNTRTRRFCFEDESLLKRETRGRPVNCKF